MLENPHLFLNLAFIGGAISVIFGIWLAVVSRQKQSPICGYIAAFFILKSGFFFLFILSFLGIFGPAVNVYLFNVAFFLLWFSLFVLVLFASYLRYHNHNKKIVITTLIVIAAAIIISLVLIPSPEEFAAYKMTSQFTGIFNFIAHLIGMVGLGLAIAIIGLKASDKKTMARSLLLGIGMVVAALTGASIIFTSHVATINGLMIVNTIAHIAMGGGVLIRPEKAEN